MNPKHFQFHDHGIHDKDSFIFAGKQLGQSYCHWNRSSRVVFTSVMLFKLVQATNHSMSVFCQIAVCRCLCQLQGVFIAEVPFSENFKLKQKPIPMKRQLQKPNTKPIFILPKITIFNQILTRAFSKYPYNTKKIPRNLGYTYQIPIWYWYFLGIPNFWFPIDITSLLGAEAFENNRYLNKIRILLGQLCTGSVKIH